jgi:hypothetical protein
MSAGAFENGKYESNGTSGIHAVRVQPETKALTIGGVANAYPAGAIDAKPSAQVGRGKRSIGINCRTVSIRLTAALTGYKSGSVIVLPWFVPSTFDALTVGSTGTYLATACEVVGTTAEKVR